MLSRMLVCLSVGVLAVLQSASADGQFAIDMKAQDVARRMNVATVGDLTVGDTGFVASFAPCVERQGLYIPTLATVIAEPSEFAQILRIEIDADGSIALELYVGSEVPDPPESHRGLALTLANASSCAAEDNYFPNDYSELRAVVSINGFASLAGLVESLAK